MDCQWVEDHLEAFFCDSLAAEENRRARSAYRELRRVPE